MRTLPRWRRDGGPIAVTSVVGAKRASMFASGKETRGAGTAKSNVPGIRREEGGDTLGTVHTDLNVTGKPAQFGRGVMTDVGEKIIGQFAQRFEAMLREGDAAEQEPTGDAASQETPRPTGKERTSDAPAVTHPTGPRKIPQTRPGPTRSLS